MVILIAIPLTIIYVKYTTESDFAITSAKVSSIANEISKQANSAYVYGQDTQLAIDVDFPGNLESISFSGKDIIFRVYNKQGDVVDIVKQSEVNLTSGTSSIPITQGKKRIIVKSLGNRVLVQIPCTSGESACVGFGVAGCDKSPGYCKLTCSNSAWGIIQTCTNNVCTVGCV